MVGTNSELLEGIISTTINTKYPDIPPTEAEFDTEVNALRQSLAVLYPVSDEEFAEIKRKLKANIVVQMDLGVLIKDRQQHLPWLSARRSTFDFFFWNRYKKFLEEVKHWNPRVTGNLGRVSDEIVDYLGDPQSDAPFQRRGLVLGDVQSGKTANYTAICNKAADAGYRVIIILAGTMENLRQQTQERLDAEFSGRMSQYLLDPKQEIENVPVGVGKYGQEKQIATFTSVTKDFDKNILRALKLSLHNVNTTVLFVIKKNKSILNNLIKWLKSNNLDARGAINLPMLLIDDEADNASVNTKKEDEDPTAINDAIRRLLKLFRQASYLGITATPYANIFINPETTDDMRDDDLFPRDFIYSLAPPTNYIGAESIFGEEAQFNVTLYMDLPIWVIMGVLFVRSMGTAFHSPALNAATPLLVPEDQLTKCAGYSQTIQAIGSIISPAAAAFLYTVWNLNHIVLLDIVGAAIACISVAIIAIPNPLPGSIEENVMQEMKAGYMVLKENKGLFALLWIGALYMFFYMPISALYPLMSMGYFGGTPTHASIAEIAFAIGMLVGGVILSVWGGFKKRTFTIGASVLMMGIGVAISGILPPNAFVAFAICCMVMGVSAPFYGVQNALFQEKIKPEYLGRVFSLLGSVMSFAMPLGLLCSGLFAEQIGVEKWFLISGIGIITISFLVFVLPGVQSLDNRTI